MSNFSLDIRWWMFAIITIGLQCSINDCAKHKKTYGVNENSDNDWDPETTREYNDPTTKTEVDCPVKCSCLGDLADCSKNNFEEIPNIPSWAKKL